jgi:hypothetical protein
MGNLFHQINTAINGPSIHNAGISISGNRFDGDVAHVFAGPPTPSGARPSEYAINLSRVVANHSNAHFADAFAFWGSGIVTITITGTVEGVGNTAYHRVLMCDGLNAEDVTPVATIGPPFDVRLIPVDGVLILGMRPRPPARNAISMTVRVKLEGHFTTISYV